MVVDESDLLDVGHRSGERACFDDVRVLRDPVLDMVGCRRRALVGDGDEVVCPVFSDVRRAMSVATG